MCIENIARHAALQGHQVRRTILPLTTGAAAQPPPGGCLMTWGNPHLRRIAFSNSATHFFGLPDSQDNPAFGAAPFSEEELLATPGSGHSLNTPFE